MGLFKALFGSNKQKGKMTDLKQKTEKLRADNKAWEADSKKVIALRQEAQDLERRKELEKAIETYLLSIKTGEKSEKLSFNNFAFDIQRVIILLGKTKQKEQLKEFLREKINKYPTVKESETWKDRLQKLEGK